MGAYLQVSTLNLPNIFYYFILTGKKNPKMAPVTFPTNVIAPITPELKPSVTVNQVITLCKVTLNQVIFLQATF